MHTPRSNSPLLFDIKNMQQIHTAKYMLPLSICSRSSRHASALAAGSLRQDHAWITAEQLFRFHKYEFDDVLCKLNATEYTRSFQIQPCHSQGKERNTKEREREPERERKEETWTDKKR